MTVSCDIRDCGYNEKGLCGKGILNITQHGNCGYLYDKYGELKPLIDPNFNFTVPKKKEITVLETTWYEED